jgi:hypothetical protein
MRPLSSVGTTRPSTSKRPLSIFGACAPSSVMCGNTADGASRIKPSA